MTDNKEDIVTACKDCMVEVLEFNDRGHDSHYKCPKCNKVLFYGGEGELKIIKGRKKIKIHKMGRKWRKNNKVELV